MLKKKTNLPKTLKYFKISLYLKKKKLKQNIELLKYNDVLMY